MFDISPLEQAYRDAYRALAEILRDQTKAFEDAKAVVLAAYADRIASATALQNSAKAAMESGKVIAAEKNPLVGRKVIRPAKISSGRWGDHGYPEKRGIIEVWERGAASRRRYLPEPGSLILRLLKKNGTPGSDYETIGDKLPREWRLMD